MMLDLQKRGCHNINLVTPTHVMPHILNAARIACHKGLRLPLCYNTGGYERLENIQLLQGIVDIYLPDLKFMHPEYAQRYTLVGAEDYPSRAQEAILEMHSQVGALQTDAYGIAQRGLMLRHLVMPNHVAGSREFAHWVAENLPLDTYVNIMAQYRVQHLAFDYQKINRSITSQEFVQAVEWAKQAGLENLDKRTLSMYEVHKQRL
jgi:putative pyruvate formate lyase activating enzyme